MFEGSTKELTFRVYGATARQKARYFYDSDNLVALMPIRNIDAENALISATPVRSEATRRVAEGLCRIAAPLLENSSAGTSTKFRQWDPHEGAASLRVCTLCDPVCNFIFTGEVRSRRVGD